MPVSLYQDQSLVTGGKQRLFLSSRAAVFAEVVVDIQAQELADKLFTYRVPDYLASETFVGAQVLVPFGGQELVGGYVMAVTDRCPDTFKAKDIVDVLDKDPLFDPSYVDFLFWIADYYCASLSSVVAAAIPADFGPRLKRVVELTGSVESPISPGQTDDACRKILEALKDSRGQKLSLRALKQRSHLTQSQFYRALAALRHWESIRICAETTVTATPKLISTIALTGEAAGSPRHEQVLSVLRHAGGQLPLPRLMESAGTSYATIKRMISQNLLVQAEEEVVRDPLIRVSPDLRSSEMPVLTAYQSEALDSLSAALTKVLSAEPVNQIQEVQPFLLHGVTGSGKTELYLRLIAQTLSAGRTALLLVPEISLTPQLASRLKGRFGHQVAIWHSGLSPGERYDTWRRLRCRDVAVLLGARSAVLASMPDLGLIILDEEHDSSYKQSNPSPRYHARTLALEKARRLGALVLLGSATPDVASYSQARDNDRLLQLPERVFKQEMPAVTVVDMRAEATSGNRSIFSNCLSQALESCLKRNEQAILLMNRRGYSNHVFCRSCGNVLRCNHCSVSLVFHQPTGKVTAHMEGGHFTCHHCGFSCRSTTVCPACQRPFLKQYGLGTQRVEQELKQLCPTARLARLDADIAARKGALESVLESFAAGAEDILIGTQMVAKGLDIPKVTLVGVLAADAAFNLPDYRSTERGFQLLTQVAGRAGRGDRPGQVVLQTYATELPALKLAQNHDYLAFATAELASRNELKYPPYSQIIRIVLAGAQADAVEASCEKLAEELTNFIGDEIPPEQLSLLGPAPCLLERLRGAWRFHLLVKNLAGDAGQKLVTSFFRTRRPPAGMQLTVDVDAFDLL